MVQPGWYPHPDHANAAWWWDGFHWTVSKSDYEQVPRPKRKRGMFFVVAVVAGFVGLLVGYGMGAAKDTTSNTSNTLSAVTSAPQKPAQSPKAPEKPKGPATSMADGVWLVGTDIAPGTYRTKDAVTSGTCYWAVGKPNADLPDKNDMVQGGRPTVTLTTGKQFKSQFCGEWVKVG